MSRRGRGEGPFDVDGLLTPADGGPSRRSQRRRPPNAPASPSGPSALAATGAGDGRLPSSGTASAAVGAGGSTAAGDPDRTSPAAARRRHPWARRLLIGFNLLLLAAVLVTGAGFAYAFTRYRQIERVAPRTETGGPVLRPQTKGQPFNILLVGSDTRDLDLDPNKTGFGSKEQTPGERSDVILLVRVEPGSRRLRVLSIPRDLWVTLENGSKERINAAFEGGGDKGAGQLIRTIDRELGIPINHYAEVNFSGFQSIVDAVGGVNVYFSSPVKDDYSGLDINQTGCVRLNGVQALSYVRSRHLKYEEGGRWIYDPYGDLTRMERQQDFMRRVASKTVSEVLTDPVKLNNVIAASLKVVKLDDALSSGDLVNLAQEFRDLKPEDIQMFIVPTDDRTTAGGAMVQELRRNDAKPIVAQFIPTPPTTTTQPGASTSSPPSVSASTIPKGSISARVTNATSVSGLGGRVASQLRDQGVNVTGVFNSDRALPATRIQYAPGAEEKAKTVAVLLGLNVTPVPAADLAGSEVQVDVGPDLSQPRPAPVPSASEPTTTPSTTAPSTTAPSTTAPRPSDPPVTLKGSDPSRACPP